MLHNEYLVAKVDVDTAKNEPSKVWPAWSLPRTHSWVRWTAMSSSYRWSSGVRFPNDQCPRSWTSWSSRPSRNLRHSSLRCRCLEAQAFRPPTGRNIPALRWDHRPKPPHRTSPCLKRKQERLEIPFRRPGRSVQGERASFTALVLGCAEADFGSKKMYTSTSIVHDFSNSTLLPMFHYLFLRFRTFPPRMRVSTQLFCIFSHKKGDLCGFSSYYIKLYSEKCRIT